MKTIRLFALLFILAIPTQAKKASAIWYFLAQTSTSVHEDENIHIQYGIYTKYAQEEYALGPYPTMRIKATNKTDQIIYIDLGTSYLKKNDFAQAIYSPTIISTSIGKSVGVGINAGTVARSIGIGGMVGDALGGLNIGGASSSSSTTTTYAQRIVSIPPKSSIMLEDIAIFIPGNERFFGNLFYFKEVGHPKRLWCISPKFDDVKSGEMREFTEESSLFDIGCYLSYAFSENMTDCKGIETKYYVKKLVGSSFSTFPLTANREFNIVDKVFPEWRSEVESGRLEAIRLWAHD
ncbi:MAG: hypothetical protein IJ607_10310 [Bacteroidaceae bacterium]|nr:hypothetical protein [Bacteroidaceae bacterium]